jgi:pilus assembly protein Flp/PilA
MQKAYCTLISLIAVASNRLEREEKGATAVEYGLMVGLIAVVIIAAVTLLGKQLKGLFESISGSLPGGAAPAAPAAG